MIFEAAHPGTVFVLRQSNDKGLIGFVIATPTLNTSFTMYQDRPPAMIGGLHRTSPVIICTPDGIVHHTVTE